MPLGALIGAVLADRDGAGRRTGRPRGGGLADALPAAVSAPTRVSNAEAIGRVLYTDYIYFFQAAGLVLLVGHDRRHRADAAPQARRARRQVIADAAARARRRPACAWSRSSRARGSANDHRTDHYLAVAAILFTIGVFGIFVNRKNIIVILMSIELILLAVNINLVAFSVYLRQPDGADLRHVRADRRRRRGGRRPGHPRHLLP